MSETGLVSSNYLANILTHQVMKVLHKSAHFNTSCAHRSELTSFNLAPRGNVGASKLQLKEFQGKLHLRNHPDFILVLIHHFTPPSCSDYLYCSSSQDSTHSSYHMIGDTSYFILNVIPIINYPASPAPDILIKTYQNISHPWSLIHQTVKTSKRFPLPSSFFLLPYQAFTSSLPRSQQSAISSSLSRHQPSANLPCRGKVRLTIITQVTRLPLCNPAD